MFTQIVQNKVAENIIAYIVDTKEKVQSNFCTKGLAVKKNQAFKIKITVKYIIYYFWTT